MRIKLAWIICGFSVLLVFLSGEAIASNMLQVSPDKSDYYLFLPAVVNRYPLETTFGMQLDPQSVQIGFSNVEDLKSSFVRYNRLNWSLIEHVQGERMWSEMEVLEEGLLRVSQAGMETILVVHGTPTWAQSIPGAPCSRILTDSLDAFGDFLYDAVRRYSYPPYNVMYWEIWNEPDIGYSEDLADMPFGCWADYNDEVWGGEYYAKVLRIVYPRIKAANPNAQVVIGGLHLDCDPRPESNYCAAVMHSEKQPLYLTGILRAGGGDYFDGVGFHAYDYFHYWQPELGAYSNRNWGAGWDTSGPSINVKAEYIGEVLDEFGVEGKFLIDTEGSLICGPIDDWFSEEGCESADESIYEQTKARYVTQLYVSSIASNLRSSVWYSILGYRHAELVDPADLSLRPAYYSDRFSCQILADAAFLGELELQSGIRAYEFKVKDQHVWVLWALDREFHAVELAEMPKYEYDYIGNVIEPVNPLTVTLDPLYLVWTP